MGSFSIEDITQSNTNSDILTFTIKETGFPYNSIYITLNKFNSEGNFMQYVHYVKINRTIEAHSNNSFMLGGNYNGIWYLNVNTSNLQPGNYLLHAELTIDALKSFTIFGSSKKYADKLFYIAPNSTKCFLDSTQELNNSSRSPSI